MERSAAPLRFQAALQSLQNAHIRPEVHLSEAAAPKRVAPFAVAIDGEVYPSFLDDAGEVFPAASDVDPDDAAPSAEGTLVVLYDPQGQENWHGQFRLISYLEAEVDRAQAADPMLPGVAWTWITDAIGHYPVHNLSGTVSLVSSSTFDADGEKLGKAILQIRTSWSPTSELVGPHLSIWAEMLATAGGLEHLPSAVASLEDHRNARQHESHHPEPGYESINSGSAHPNSAHPNSEPARPHPLANLSPHHPSLHHNQHPLNTTV